MAKFQTSIGMSIRAWIDSCLYACCNRVFLDTMCSAMRLSFPRQSIVFNAHYDLNYRFLTPRTVTTKDLFIVAMLCS
jgi:hypothetical protein